MLVPHGVQRQRAGLVELQQLRVGRVHQEAHAVLQRQVLRQVSQVSHSLLVFCVPARPHQHQLDLETTSFCISYDELIFYFRS